MVHLGLGAFFRAHQAWYTDRAADADGWGIAAFTGRSAALAETLRGQDCAYTLVTQGPSGPAFERIASLSDVRAASEHDAWLDYLSRPEVAVVTTTVTEAGYHPGAGGAPERLLAGLAARRAAGAGAISLVPCDNLPDNGEMLRSALLSLADPGLCGWIEEHVDFVTTTVDRITPATTDADRALVLAETGFDDRAPVVTEPYSEWVLSGGFPAGRPDWDATFVDDVAPYEQRKLWLLNGAHSLMAYAGIARGHQTVAQAIADPTLRGWVEEWWDEAAARLPQPAAEIGSYRAALLTRFANPGIRHLLSQIALDGTRKIPARILPSLRAERAERRMPVGSTRPVAAWVRHVAGAEPTGATVVEVLGEVAPDLAGDRDLVAALVSMPDM